MRTHYYGMGPIMVTGIALVAVARALDAMLDGVMTAQARILAHLVAAGAAAGQDAAGLIATIDTVAAATVLDEVWVSNEQGVCHITNVRDASGEPTAFRFESDPAEQPQAYVFYPLLAASIDSDDVVTQEARVREIDNEIFKYVGVAGVDRPRIVQVGNALAFEEQAALADTYVSPVMTAVTAAFDEPDLFGDRRTSEYDEIRMVFEGILGQHMIVQATLVDYFLAGAERAGWPAEAINERLQRIVRSTPISEIHVAAQRGEALYSSAPAGRRMSELAHAGDLAALAGLTRAVDHPTPSRADGPMTKHVTVAGSGAPRVVQVECPLDDGSPVSPRFGS